MKNEINDIGQISARMPKQTIDKIKRLIKDNKEEKGQPSSIQDATQKYWRNYLKKHGITLNDSGQIIDSDKK